MGGRGEECVSSVKGCRSFIITIIIIRKENIISFDIFQGKIHLIQVLLLCN